MPGFTLHRGRNLNYRCRYASVILQASTADGVTVWAAGGPRFHTAGHPLALAHIAGMDTEAALPASAVSKVRVRSDTWWVRLDSTMFVAAQWIDGEATGTLWTLAGEQPNVPIAVVSLVTAAMATWT